MSHSPDSRSSLDSLLAERRKISPQVFWLLILVLFLASCNQTRNGENPDSQTDGPAVPTALVVKSLALPASEVAVQAGMSAIESQVTAESRQIMRFLQQRPLTKMSDSESTTPWGDTYQANIIAGELRHLQTGNYTLWWRTAWLMVQIGQQNEVVEIQLIEGITPLDPRQADADGAAKWGSQKPVLGTALEPTDDIQLGDSTIPRQYLYAGEAILVLAPASGNVDPDSVGALLARVLSNTQEFESADGDVVPSAALEAFQSRELPE